MQLSPKCFDAVKYHGKINFTDVFMMLCQQDKQTEYHWYKQELDTIGKFYAEVSEPEQEVIRWKNAFKASKVGNDCVSVDKLYFMKHLETLCIIEYTNYSATCALVVGMTVCLLKSKQSTVINQFWKLQNERQNIVVKNALIENKTNMQKNKAKAKLDQHVTIVTVIMGQIQQYARSTTTKILKKFLDEKERTVKRTKTYKESDNNDNTENDHLFLLSRNDTKDGTQTPPHQITRNTFFAQFSASETHESILRASSEYLTGLDKVKYFKKFIPLFEEYKDCEKNNVYSCTNDDVMGIRGDGVIKEYYKESLTEDGLKKTISDWVCITNALIVVNDEDTEEITRLKKYLYRVMLPLIESFLKPILNISAPNSSEYHYWSEFRHHFFSYALQEFTVYKVVEGKCANLLAWSWETGEEIFVGKQAGPPTKPDLIKLSIDSFKFYRELRDCLNVRILNAMKIGDVNYTNHAVLEYLDISSHSKNIHMMKLGILKLLEFIMVIKMELKYTAEIENDNDKAQILKRKFSDFIQTKPLPIKVIK
ncbi:14315_t:CDS:10, partial [Funneliformis caledonium]